MQTVFTCNVKPIFWEQKKKKIKLFSAELHLAYWELRMSIFTHVQTCKQYKHKSVKRQFNFVTVSTLITLNIRTDRPEQTVQRPSSDATECSIWSGPTLFATDQTPF